MSIHKMTLEELKDAQSIISEEFHKHQNDVNYEKIQKAVGCSFYANTKRAMCDLSIEIEDLIESKLQIGL